MIDDLAIEIFNEHTLAGLAAGVVRDGRLEHFTGLGLADAEAGRPIERDTVFRIGSISKTMTAIAVMQLVEEGAFGLDDAVNDLGSRARVEAPAPVTVRHLLTHTSGLGELRRFSDLKLPAVGLGAKLDAPPPALGDYYAKPLKTRVTPGAKWAYANHGFALLGLIVEDLRGRPFPEVMRERVFAPLGMERTDFERTPRVAERLAVGYRPARRGFKPVKDLEIAVGPAGSCYSTTEDMARYVAALASGGGPLLRPQSLARMLEPQGEPDPGMPAIGLSFFVERLGGHRVAGHDGGWAGFISALAFAPDDGVGVLAFTNTSTAFAPHVLAERALARLLDAAAEPPAVPQHPHAWAELVGVYKLPEGLNTNVRWWPLLGGEVEIAVRKGKLVARALSPVRELRKGVRLHAVDAEDPLRLEARVEDWRVPVVFERGADGAVVALRTGSTRGGFLRLHRRSPAASLRRWARAGAGAGSLAAAAAAWRRLR
jgi:CubicO group peptidase (beta-lactamase class C family)